MNKKNLILISTSILILATVFSFTSKKKLSVEGIWRFVEVKTVKPDGSSTSTFPKEGLAIFADNHYSINWTSHVSENRSWQLADTTKLNRFNQSSIQVLLNLKTPS